MKIAQLIAIATTILFASFAHVAAASEASADTLEAKVTFSGRIVADPCDINVDGVNVNVSCFENNVWTTSHHALNKISNTKMTKIQTVNLDNKVNGNNKKLGLLTVQPI